MCKQNESSENVVALTIFINSCPFIVRMNTLPKNVRYISKRKTLIHQDHRDRRGQAISDLVWRPKRKPKPEKSKDPPDRLLLSELMSKYFQ